jgi:type 1 glutamine amidotransferase
MCKTIRIGMLGILAAGLGLFTLAASAQNVPKSRPAGRTLLPIPKELQKEIPPQRTREEVESVLAPAKEGDLKPLHIVLVAGPKDHGPGEHDYPAWQKAWKLLLSDAPKVRVTTAWEKPSAEDLKTADVLVLFKHFAWPRELNEQIDAFLARGGGIVLLHFAVDAGDNAESVGKNLGLYWGAGAKYRHGALDLQFADEPNVPFLHGLAGKKIHFFDETYWRLTGDASKLKVLASATEDDGDGKTVQIPLIWNNHRGKGRVHVNILGHFNWTFNDPLFRILVLRGIAWAANQPIDRFGPLASEDVLLKE